MRMDPSDWKTIQAQAAESSLLWRTVTKELTDLHTKLMQALCAKEASVEDIRYIQGQIDGLERGILVVGKILKRADRALARSERRVDAKA